jgi:transposase
VLLDSVPLNLRGGWRGTTGYPPEFRRKVLDLVEAGRPIAEVAKALGISDQSIYTWRRQDRIDRGLEPGLTSTEKSELGAAKRRIAELETELHCLASGFVSDIGVLIRPHPVGSSGLEQEGGDDPAGLRTRSSGAAGQAVAEPEPEVRAVVAAGDRRAEPERGGRALGDRPLHGHAHPAGRRAGALEALAASKPGVRQAGEDAELAAARAEIARLGEAVKEQAIELMLLRGKSRWG